MATKQATAGSLESNDVLIVLEEQAGASSLEIRSIVLAQFGDQIEATVAEVLAASGLTGVRVLVQDKGAYDCTIRARMETVIARYQEVGHAQA